jgi:hypothetical protein
MAKRIKHAKQKIRQWLKSKGHEAKRVDSEVNAKDANLAVAILHGVLVAEYNSAKAK